MKSDSIQRHRAQLLSYAQHLRALLGIILATCGCMLALAPAPAFAADTGVISVATVEDTPYREGKADIIDMRQDTQRVADIYQGLQYKLHVELSNLNIQGTGLNKTVEVKLAQGVRWINDTDAVLTECLDTTKGTNGIRKINLPKLANKFDLDGGTRIYYLEDGIQNISFDLYYSYDEHFMPQTGTVITDPITITVKEGSTTVGSAKLKGLTNNIDFGKGEGAPTWEGALNFNRVIGETGFIDSQKVQYMPPRYSKLALSDEVLATLVVSDPRAQIVGFPDNQSAILDSTGAAQGIYKVKSPDNPAYKLVLGRAKFSINLPMEADFEAGTKITVTCHYEIKAYDVDGSPCSKTCPDGIYTVTAVAPNSQIFINSADVNKPVKDVNKNRYLGYLEGVLSEFNVASAILEKGKTVEQHFDPAAHIYAVEVINPAGTDNPVGMTFNVAWIPAGQTQERTKTVTLPSNTINNKSQNLRMNGNLGQSTVISFGDLGLSKDDSITMLKYKTDIPSTSGIDLFAIGKIDNISIIPTSTLEIYHINAEYKKETTGVAKSTVQTSTAISLNPLTPGDTNVTAGSRTQEFTFDPNFAYGSRWHPYTGLRNPIYYIVISLKDNAGNYLKIFNPKTSDSSGKWYNLTDDILHERVVPNVGRVYMVDTKELANKYATDTYVPLFNTNMAHILASSDGAVKLWPRNFLRFRIDIPRNVDAQSQRWGSMVYIEDSEYDSNVVAFNAGGALANKVDLRAMGISERQHPNGGSYFATSSSTDDKVGLSIHSNPDFTVDTSVKHESSQDYIEWNEGDKPIPVGNSSSFDIKVDLNNGAGAPLNAPTVAYIPIPKKDQYWGGLNKDGEAFNFDIKLNKRITMAGKASSLNTNHVHIEYGRVTPSDSEATLAAGSWTSTFNASQAENYNCVRITVDEIPANDPEKGTDTYSFIMNCSAASTATEEGAINTFRPLYYKNITIGSSNYDGFYKGSWASIEAALGEIRGRLFVDKDKDGDLDAGEELTLANVEVQAFKDGNTVATAKTDAQGQYHFKELRTGDIYVLRVNNPDKNKYVFTRPGTANVQGQPGNSTNQFIGQSNDTVGQAAAAYPMKPEGSNPTAATYNIGLMSGDAAKTTFTFEAGDGTFADGKQTATVSGMPTAKVTAPQAERAGYSYIWYEKDDPEQKEAKIPSTFGYDDKTFVAKWTANTNTKYKVELYYMQKYGIWPTEPQKTLELEGTTDAKVSFNAATQRSFSDTTWEAKERSKKTYKLSTYKKSTLSGTVVAGDKPLTLKVYYDIAKGPDPCFQDVTHKQITKNGKKEYIDWFCNVVHDVNDMGLITGYDGTENAAGIKKYGPRDNITRAQIVVILWRMSGAPNEGEVSKFPDIEKTYHKKALTWAGNHNVANGYSDGRFGPDDKVTREQLATFIANFYRFKTRKAVSGSRSDFRTMKDKGTVRDTYVKSVGWCFKNGILEGTTNTMEIKPRGNATRGDAAKMFQRFYTLLEKE